MTLPLPVQQIKPTDLPAPPKEALAIVQACTDPDVTSQKLSEIIASDPQLTAELLRISNSAYFGVQKEVATASRAVTILGQRALRNLVLCIAMRDALNEADLPGIDVHEFWQEGLRRAVAAKALASYAKTDPEASFTAGLLQDFGLLVMVYMHPEKGTQCSSLADLTPAERYAQEKQIFGMTHDDVGFMLAKNWGLPEDLALTMGYHHRKPPADSSTHQQLLCTIAMIADWMAAVFNASDPRLVIQHCRTLTAEHLSMDIESCDEILDQIGQGVEDAAAALGMSVDQQKTFDAILKKANLRLVEENISYQELTWKLEKTLEERDRYAAELDQELELAREVQRSLLPNRPQDFTGILGMNISAKQVSGDFYDYYYLKDGRIYFCLADVSGKGMNAALLMAKTSSLFHCLGKTMQDPSKLLAVLNREIYETSIRGMFVTLIAGLYDAGKDHIRLVNAGHVPAMLLRKDGSYEHFPSEAPPLGILADAKFPGIDLQLDGGSLYLFTDGLLEARTEKGDRYEEKGLEALFREHRDIPAFERIQRIIDSVNKTTNAVDDDLTLMLVEAGAKHG